jgi:hypothetical protein
MLKFRSSYIIKWSCLDTSWCRYWNDPEVLAKLGKAMGNVFEVPTVEGGEEGDEEEEEEEATLHSAASAGASTQHQHGMPAMQLCIVGCDFQVLGATPASFCVQALLSSSKSCVQVMCSR